MSIIIKALVDKLTGKTVEPPQELVRIINEDCAGENNVEAVLIGTGLGVGPGKYIYHSKTILLDLEDIMFNKNRLTQHMLLLPAMWYSVLLVWWHELAHADQLESNPALALLPALPAKQELDADQYALERVLEWTSKQPTPPSIATMGWLGEKIRDMVNTLYHKYPTLADELDYMYKGAAMYASQVTCIGEFSDSALTELVNQVGEGKLGVVADDGNKFIDANDYFGICADSMHI